MIHERGNVLFLILLAVVLLAALSYAVTNSTRGAGKDASSETATLNATVIEGYMTQIEVGRQRLTSRGCTSIDYTAPAAQSGSGDKSCFMFNVAGAGVIYQELGLNGCQLEGKNMTDLTVGTGCGGLVYAGTSGGKRIYTTAADSSSGLNWKGGSYNLATGASSTSNGVVNTDVLMGLGGYAAATACRALGADWYLPADDEMSTLYNSRNAGLFAGTYTADTYWTSTSLANHSAHVLNFTNGVISSATKNNSERLRCVRSD